MLITLRLFIFFYSKVGIIMHMKYILSKEKGHCSSLLAVSPYVFSLCVAPNTFYFSILSRNSIAQAFPTQGHMLTYSHTV